MSVGTGVSVAVAVAVSVAVLVMVAGRIVEQGPTDEVLHRPLHDYTKLLLSAVPDPASGLHADAWPGRGDIERFRDEGTPTALVEERPGHWVRRPTGRRPVAAATETDQTKEGR